MSYLILPRTYNHQIFPSFWLLFLPRKVWARVLRQEGNGEKIQISLIKFGTRSLNFSYFKKNYLSYLNRATRICRYLLFRHNMQQILQCRPQVINGEPEDTAEQDCEDLEESPILRMHCSSSSTCLSFLGSACGSHLSDSLWCSPTQVPSLCMSPRWNCSWRTYPPLVSCMFNAHFD